MGNYITIVSRSEFNDLYKFGHIFVHNMIPLEGELIDHVDDKSLFDAVTAYMNTYEYSTEYLLLNTRKTAFVGSSVEIFIRDVVGVYALNTEAQANLKISLDKRINLQVSCWEKYFNELNKKHSIRQSKAGKFNCYEIFQISNEERIIVDKILPKNFIEDLFNDLYEKKRPNGEKSLWTYLIRYERHHPYWNDVRGYFSDAIHIFENFLQKHEIDYEIAEESPLTDLLMRCNINFDDIYQAFNRSADNKYRVDGCNYFAVAALYLYMKSYFKDGGITTAKFYQDEKLSRGILHNKYGNDFALAVALLGINLGQDLTYSCYYEIKNLGIFNMEIQSKIGSTKITDPSTGNVLSNIEAQTLINQLSITIENNKEEIIKLKETIDQLKATTIVTQQELNNVALETIGQKSEALNNETLTTEESSEVLEMIPERSLIQETIQIKQELSFPIEMKKLARDKKTFSKAKNSHPKWAHNQQEYDDLINSNWVPSDYFNPQK